MIERRSPGPTMDPVAFGTALVKRLGESAGDRDTLEQVDTAPLPGNPWARRLIVALEGHVHRQRWVAEVLRDDLHADPLAVASGGAFEHPDPGRGQLPVRSGWSYAFHGIGCCVTHEDGTAIDVDFDEHGADAIDPYFYSKYLDSLQRPSGLEATLRRPKPLNEWWMAELDVLRELGWIEGEHRVHVTSLGTRWAAALRPAFDVITATQAPADQLRAAILIEDFPWAVELTAPPSSVELRRRADEWTAVRASQLEAALGAGRARCALAALVVLDRERAVRSAEDILGHSSLDGLTSLALQVLLADGSGPEMALLLALATRARGTTPPAPHLRTQAIAAILKRYRADSLPDDLRLQILRALEPEAHSGEGIAALLHSLVDPERGIARLGRCLRHAVPVARADAAAALALLGTPDAAAILREGGDGAEAKAALALLRGNRPEPGPEPEGEFVNWRGTPRRVYSADEILAAGCPWLVESELGALTRDLGPLLERWWAQ